jgi:prefoldin subunit 5
MYPPQYSSGYPPTPYRYQAPPSLEDEIAALEESKKNLEEELKGVEARIEELKRETKKA